MAWHFTYDIHSNCLIKGCFEWLKCICRRVNSFLYLFHWISHIWQLQWNFSLQRLSFNEIMRSSKTTFVFFISATFQTRSKSKQSEMFPTELWLKFAQVNQCLKQLNFGSSLPQVKQCLSCEHVWFGSSQAMTIAFGVAQFGRLLQELFLAQVF